MTEEVIAFAHLDSENMPFVIQCTGITYPDPSYSIFRGCSRWHVLEYVIGGSGIIETPNGILRPKAGDAYFLRADEPHRYSSDPKDPWHKIWVNFRGTLVNAVLDAYGLKQSEVFSGLDIQTFISRIHQIAGAGVTDPEPAMDAACGVFLELCQFIHKHGPSQEPVSHIPRNMAVLKDYLDSHYHEQITLEKCAEMTYLSASQTIRSFRAAYQATPYEYLNQCRIRAAKLLLKNTALSIDEIALRTGFADKNYFSKYFKRKVGLSPRKYRQQ